MSCSKLLPFAAAGLAASCLATSVSAATTYSLAGDDSQISNPNGVRSFTLGAAPLTSFTPSTANPINAALADGHWGVVSDLDTSTPRVGRATVNGASAAPYTSSDFPAGDVLLHTTNPGAVDLVFVRWTAPADGSIDYSVSAWHARSLVNRVGEVMLSPGSLALLPAGLGVAGTLVRRCIA